MKNRNFLSSFGDKSTFLKSPDIFELKCEGTTLAETLQFIHLSTAQTSRSPTLGSGTQGNCFLKRVILKSLD